MEPKAAMEVSEQVREFAEKSVNQAEKAFEAFISQANKSVEMVPHPAAKLSKTALSYTETNIKAVFDHARKLVHAKDYQEAMQLQADFLKQQYAAVTDQMKSFAAGAGGIATDATKQISS